MLLQKVWIVLGVFILITSICIILNIIILVQDNIAKAGIATLIVCIPFFLSFFLT